MNTVIVGILDGTWFRMAVTFLFNVGMRACVCASLCVWYCVCVCVTVCVCGGGGREKERDERQDAWENYEIQK